MRFVFSIVNVVPMSFAERDELMPT
jgi:hypothetical protein